ncbi:hypothetical protein QV65_23230 [Rhodococcus erythropolis]|nr:hypothetical protein QV65_23230 [Rhodococcus erythropolis]
MRARGGVDLVLAGEVNLEVKVRAGGEAAVADSGDLVAGHDLLTDGDGGRVDVAVDGDRSVCVL